MPEAHLPSRRWFYPLFVLAVFLKSSFGYEYIPNVMLGAIFFLCVEWLYALKTDKKRASLLFKTIWGVGISCLAGFFLAICLNGYFRGGGDLIAGIRDIYEKDVIRRTFGNAADFDATCVTSLNASLLTVILKYVFLSGVSLLSSGLLVIDLWLLLRRRQKPDFLRDLLLLILGYLFCMSWNVLAKSHAYIHRFSDVMFLLPFLQTGFYLLLKNIHEEKPQLISGLFNFKGKE